MTKFNLNGFTLYLSDFFIRRREEVQVFIVANDESELFSLGEAQSVVANARRVESGTSSAELQLFFEAECKKTFGPGRETNCQILLLIDIVNGAFWIARDPFGLDRVFYSLLEGGDLVVGSQLSEFLVGDFNGTLSFKEKGFNLTEYLNFDSVGKGSVSENTVFSQIFSLLPAYYAFFKAGKITCSQFFRYSFSQWDGISEPGEIGMYFRQFLSASVERSVAGCKTIGSQLSGGLDSSSVASIASLVAVNNANLHTYYFNVKNLSTDSEEYVREVLKNIRTEHHEILPLGSRLETLINLTERLGRPSAAITDSLHGFNLLKDSASVGCDVMLTGLDGDTIVGYGNAYIASLFETKNGDRLRDEVENLCLARDWSRYISGWSGFSSSRKRQELALFLAIRRLNRSVRAGSYVEVVSLGHLLNTFFDVSYVRFAAAVGVKVINKAMNFRNERENYVRADVDSRFVGSLDRGRKKFLHSIGDAKDKIGDLSDIYNGTTLDGIEELSVFGRQFGVRLAHPFYDQKLIELSLSVPEEIKFAKGAGRGHFREAMKGILPEMVRTRVTKGAYNSYEGMVALQLCEDARDFLVNGAGVWDYVNKDTFERVLQYEKFRNPSGVIKAKNQFFLSRTVKLAIWLDLLKRNSFRPSL